jgi:hypothetical protein
MLKKALKSERFEAGSRLGWSGIGSTGTLNGSLGCGTAAGPLLVLQDLIDDDFAAFIHRDDFVDGDIAA